MRGCTASWSTRGVSTSIRRPDHGLDLRVPARLPKALSEDEVIDAARWDQRRRSALAPGPGAARAALRDGSAGLGGRRAQPRGPRLRRGAAARHRQGRQGAPGAGRPRCQRACGAWLEPEGRPLLAGGGGATATPAGPVPQPAGQEALAARAPTSWCSAGPGPRASIGRSAPTSFVTRARPTCWPTGPTCESSRSSSDTLRWRPRSSTPRCRATT